MNDQGREPLLIKDQLDSSGLIQSGGGGRLRRHRSDGVLISRGRLVHENIEASKSLAEDGFHLAVLDLRRLSPLDRTLINETVRAAGVHEANRIGSFGAEIAAHISEACRGSGARPERRIATPDSRIPAASNLHRSLIPGGRRIHEEIQAWMGKG